MNAIYSFLFPLIDSVASTVQLEVAREKVKDDQVQHSESDQSTPRSPIKGAGEITTVFFIFILVRWMYSYVHERFLLSCASLSSGFFSSNTVGLIIII